MSERRNAARRPIYLDYQATTPVDPRVLAAMLPYFTEIFGNPHSSAHAYGWEAEEAVEAARAELAALIGAEAREIVFTSGATEANNMAILGAGRFRAATKDRRDHVVTLATEHKCVLESCRRLEAEGMRLTVLDVGADGLVDPEAVRAAVDERTALVSVMTVNNEIGVIQPLVEISAICRAAGAWLHTDAAQAAGRIPLDVSSPRVDLMSISGHKMYGPKGIGALYVRRRPRVRLDPIFHGGGQERGMRSGTLPTPLCVGMGAAARVAAADMGADAARLADLRERFLARLRAAVPDLVVNGDMDRRVPGNLNVTLPGVPVERLLSDLRDEVAVSTGSACTSAAIEPSYVLRAIGLDDAAAASSLRIGFGRPSTVDEAERAAAAIGTAARDLRARECG